MEFIKDRWYKITNLNWWFKYIHTDGMYTIYMSESISLNGLYYSNNSIYISSNEDEFKLLEDLSEISKYLPDGHIDKIIINEIIDTSYLIEVFKKLKIK